MGYRFDLQHTNIIAHLVEGEIVPFFDEYFHSVERGQEVLEALKEITKSFQTDYYSQIFDKQEIYSMGKRLSHFGKQLYEVLDNGDFNLREVWSTMPYSEKIVVIKENEQLHDAYDFLCEVSKVFEPCYFRTLLIASPDERYSDINRCLTSEEFLQELVSFHPLDSCLILQPKEVPEKGVDIFRAFPGMHIAAQDVDEWPGILLWTKQTSGTFFPIRSIDQIFKVYDEIHTLQGKASRYLRQSISAMKKRISPSNKVYFIHLSDLHIGNVAQENADRLLELIHIEKKLIAQANNQPYVSNPKLYSLITGDLVDSPDPQYQNMWTNFRRKLVEIGTEYPYVVMGNHDYDQKGLMISEWLRKTKVLLPDLLDRKVHPIDELKLAIIKIDSNINAQILGAQGQVGETQMASLEPDIEYYSNKGYKCVAMLHHHPVSVSEPEWYRGNFFRRLLGSRVYDYTLKLTDAEKFISWANEKGISLILHGHKHIPNYAYEGNTHIIGCGSSTGKVEHSDPNRTYLSYNVLKYDLSQCQFTSCVMKFEDEIRGGAKHLSAISLV